MADNYGIVTKTFFEGLVNDLQQFAIIYYI